MRDNESVLLTVDGDNGKIVIQQAPPTNSNESSFCQSHYRIKRQLDN